MKNLDLYLDKVKLLHKALGFAAGFEKSQPDGRYDIDGDDIYALVMTYHTKAAKELKFEAHKKYIDIQLLVEGREILDVSLGTNLEVEVPYSEQDDGVLYKSPKHFTSVLLEPGVFTILYPNDIHRPGRKLEKEIPVRKMVIKVRIN
jgi:YhcH/YjgK/YiaL family protein